MRKADWAIIGACVVAVHLAARVQMQVLLGIEKLGLPLFIVPGLVGLSAGACIVFVLRAKRREAELRGRLEQQGKEVRRLNAVLEDRIEARTLELRAREAELVQAQKADALARLAGGLAHDFNNVLTVLLQGTDLISEAADQPEAVRELAGEVRESAERAGELTGKLLAMSRRRPPASPRAVDVSEVLRGVSRLVRRLMGDRSAVAIELSPQLPLIQADPTELEQVVVNLCINARDAMPQGGLLRISAVALPVSELPVALVGSEAAAAVRLAVQDTGTGIPAELVERVFEPLFTTKAEGAGTGLGLSIVRGLVEGAGGAVRVVLPEEGGTRFELFWPVLADPAATTPADSEP